MAHPPSIQRSGPARFPGRRVLRWQRPSGFPLDPRLVLLLLGVLATPLAGQQNDSDPGARSMALAAIFAQYDRPDSPGCIVGVGERGGIAYRNGFGMANLEHDVPMTPFTISEIGSVSKQFTAAALVLLAQDGFLSLDDEVRKHDPRFPDFGAPVTIRQLLNHTSGWRDQFGLLELAGRPNGGVVTSVEEVVELGLRQRTLNFPPNTDYLYSNTGFTYLNTLVERLSGQTFAEFTTERIFRPLGMTNTQWRNDYTRVVRGRAAAYQPDDRGGWSEQMPFSTLHGSGGLLTTADDLIRWTEALHADQVGKPGFLAEMTRTARLNDGRELDYALGIRVADFRGVREVSHGGSTAGYRAFLSHYPDFGLTVGIQCNAASADAGGLAASVAELFLGDALEPAPTLPAPVAVADGELQRRSGLYYDPISHQVVRLAPRDGRLVGGGLTLLPIGGDRWIQAGSGNVLTWTPPRGDEPAAFSTTEDGGRTLVARTPVTPSSADLQAMAGEYHNAEIGSSVRLAVEDGGLVLRHAPAVRVELEPAFADAFTGGGRTLVVTRGVGGAVQGFAYHAGRVRDIRFQRVPGGNPSR